MIKLIQRIALSVVTMGWAIWYLADTASRSEKAVLLIRPVVFVMFALFLINVYRDYKKWSAESAGKPATFEFATTKEVKTAFLCFGAAAVYILLMSVLGFILSTAFFLAGAFMVLKAKPVPSVIVSVTMTCLLYVTFDILLKMPMPTGFLGF